MYLHTAPPAHAPPHYLHTPVPAALPACSLLAYPTCKVRSEVAVHERTMAAYDLRTAFVENIRCTDTVSLPVYICCRRPWRTFGNASNGLAADENSCTCSQRQRHSVADGDADAGRTDENLDALRESPAATRERRWTASAGGGRDVYAPARGASQPTQPRLTLYQLKADLFAGAGRLCL